MSESLNQTASSAAPFGPPKAGARAARPIAVGDLVGRRRVTGVLGRGGMGIVYRAETDGGGASEKTTVALKLVHPHLLQKPEFMRRFHLEAEAGARIRHVNVVRTYGIETAEVDGRSVHFLVMEYVRGRTLADLQREWRRVPEGLLQNVALGIAAGLAAIHEAGVIHRDIKPENLLLTDRHEIKVMDLGVARLKSEEMRLSRTGQFVGSLLYAAPEQLSDRGGQSRAATDLYAFGLVLYSLAAGRHPFECETVGEIVQAHVNTIPAPLRVHAPEVSPFLEAVVATLLEKDPEARFPSARALLETLEAGEASAWWRARAPRPAEALPPGSVNGIGLARIEGRSRELGALSDAWRRARAGAGATVLVVGDEGSGKSRLVGVFLESVRRAPDDAFVVACLDGGTPPHALLETLKPAFPGGDAGAAITGLLPLYSSIASTLAAVLGQSTEPSESATASDTEGLLVEIVLALSAKRPRVVVFEDLDRGTDEARALFRALARAAPAAALLLVATVRPAADVPWREELLAAHAGSEITLPPLSADAMGAILEELVGSSETAVALAPEVLPRTGGNPHFLAEVVACWKASGALEEASDGRWRPTPGRPLGEVPASLSDLVARRVEALPPPTREALEAACVQGREFDVRIAAAALKRPLLAVLESFVPLGCQTRLVSGEGRVRRFDPPLVQEAVWLGLEPARRRTLHVGTAEALLAAEAAGEISRTDAVARIAGHFLLGGEDGRAAPLLVEALDDLKSRGRNGEAMELSTLALASGERLDAATHREVLLRRARLLELAGRREEERACLESALLAAERRDAPPTPRLLGAYGRCLASLSDPRSEEVFLRCLAAAELAGDTAAEATAHGNLAMTSLKRGDLHRARARGEQSLLLARSSGNVEEGIRADGLLASVFERAGRAPLAAVHQSRRLAAALRRHDRREASDAHGGLARLALRRGRFREAQVHLDLQWSAAREIGYRRGEGRARQGLGRLSLAKGRLAGALDSLREARRIAVVIASPADEAWAALDLARVLLLVGDRPQALSLMLRASGVAHRAGGTELSAFALVLAGAAAEEGDDAEEAARWYREAIAVGRGTPDGRGDVLALLGLARAAKAKGRPERMVEPLARALEIASQRGWAGPLVVARALGAAADARGPARAMASLAEHAEALAWIERLEAHQLLYEATGDAWHLLEAERTMEDADEDLAPSAREAMRRGFSLCRRVVAARAARGRSEHVL